MCLFFLPFFLTSADCTGTVRMQYSRKDNSELVQIKKFTIKIKVGKGSIKLYNLFGGDKALGMHFKAHF